MPSSYPGRHMPLPGLEPGTSGKRWVSVANWATLVGYLILIYKSILSQCFWFNVVLHYHQIVSLWRGSGVEIDPK
ncbi:hypothetical protein Hanom_Chr08g00752751 [Helianthus anomalus]